MATELDHDTIKGAMVTILKAAALFDATGASDKVRQINTGHPDHANGLDDVFPSIYITNAPTLDRIKVSGSTPTTALPGLEHTFRYRVVIQEQTKGSRTTEQSLDDRQKLVLEALEADLTLGGNVDFSRPETVELFSSSLNGKSVQGRVITYLCRKVTN
jgi:hypothetical protein